MTPRTKKKAKIAAIALLVIGITLLHYLTDYLHTSFHIVFRELYFLPIILAGFWFGTNGGAGTAMLITFFYLPYILILPGGIAGHNFGNFMQVILFNVFGLLIGLLSDRQKRQQQRLLETESLAAMGRAVSCIAHDMKTPLVAAGGFVQQVRRQIGDEKLAAKLDIAFAQVKRLEIMAQDMLAFARPLTLEYRQAMINDLIEEILTVAGEKAEQLQVSLVTELQADLPETVYDPHRMHQALLNLVNNALEASPPGGKVIIRSRCGDSHLFIEVTDQGPGIPGELSDDIFTPFRTTKKDGTGLGLAIARKVIEAHGGLVTVVDSSEKGTTFQISFPAGSS